MVARGEGPGKRSSMINTAIGVPVDRNDIDANTFVLETHPDWPEQDWHGAHPPLVILSLSLCHPERSEGSHGRVPRSFATLRMTTKGSGWQGRVVSKA